jgi:sensor histidine kinase YesM
MGKTTAYTNRVLKHISFWLFVLAFQISRSGLKSFDVGSREFRALLVEHSLNLPVLMAASYFFAFYLLPEFYYKRRYLLPGVLSVIAGIAAVLIMRTVLYYYVLPEYYPVYFSGTAGFWDFNLAQYIFYIFSIVAIVAMIKYTSQVRKIEQQRLQLEQQNLAGELALLRNQVNPHFLFNTLNNINALVRKDPELTYQSILRLSDIMRYMLYEANADKVLLVNEVNFLKNFIGLNLLRLDRSDFVEFSVTGTPASISIPPMLLVPFVENAFKHGLKETSSPGISISLGITPGKLVFSVKNLVKTVRNPELPDTKGIGLNNLKRRLELLYPGRYRLETAQQGKQYSCLLELLLESN